MTDNRGETTVYFDESMNHGPGPNSNQKNTLVIVDKNGINELDLSGYTEATYTFGRANDNSIVIGSISRITAVRMEHIWHMDLSSIKSHQISTMVEMERI